MDAEGGQYDRWPRPACRGRRAVDQHGRWRVHLPVLARTARSLDEPDGGTTTPTVVIRCSRAKDVLMPRYFIHLRNPDLWLEDCEGRDLPDLHATFEETQKANRSLPAVLDGVHGLEFEITDSQGYTRLRVPVQELGLLRSSAAMLH